MIFLKKLFKKEEAHPVELALEIGREVATRLKLAADLRLNKQYELALAECNNVLGLHPANHLAYQIRALIRYDMNDQDGAIRDWNRFKSLRKNLK